jgi:hypothetical protein
VGDVKDFHWLGSMRSAERRDHGKRLGLSQQQLKHRTMTEKRDSIGTQEIKEMMANGGDFYARYCDGTPGVFETEMAHRS